MKSHSKRILSLVFALLMLFQQVMFAAQTVDLFNPELGAKTVDLIPGEDDTNTVDLLTPSEEDSTKTVDLLNPEQPSATIEQQKPIIEKNESKTVDTITPRGDDIVPAEGKKSTTTIVVGGDEIEEGETNENSEISPEEIILPEENEKEEKKDASFEDEEHHENAGVLPWSTDLVKPWSIYRAPKTVYRPGEDLDLTELLVEIKTGRSGSLYNIEDLINDEFTTITRTRKSDGQKVRLDDKIYEDETMTIHMDGCQDLTIDFTVDENLKDETKAFEAFQQNLIREEFRNGLDFSLYLIKKGEKENPVVAYSLDPHKLTPIGNGVDKKLKDGPLFDLKDINSWDRYDIETIGKVKAILERSAEIKDTENIRKKLITQLAIWNVTSNIIPEEIDATVSEPTEIAPELKPAEETKENPEEDKKDEPIEITEPTTPEEETENIEKDDEKVEDTKDETVEIKTEEKVEEKAETEENKESEKIEEKAPVQSTVHKIVFNAKEIDVPYDDIELSDEEYELYKELTSLEAVELKNEDEDLKIYEPIIIEETENQYAELVTIGATDIESIERVATEVTFDAVDYSFQNLYHTLETSSMLGFGQPRDFNVLLKATMKASRKIVKGDKFEVEILSKTLPILNGEEGRANDIQIDGKIVATAEYIAEEHKIIYTFVEDLDTDKVEIEQEFKQIKEEKAALLNMLDVSENLVLDAVRGAEGDENSEENPDELEISPEDDNAAIKLVLGNTPVQYNGYSFETKKFRLKTTMTAKAAPVWQIPIDWTFDVNIGPYLKPDPKNPLKSLYDPNNPNVEVARPKYDPDKHVITYTFIKPLNNTKTFNIDQLLAFDTDKIANREEIEINIVIAPKNYKVQKMPTIKVRKDDPRSEIISQFVVENKQDLYKVVYPYMVSYVSRQSVNNGTVTWDIDVDTSTLKREGLDYNNIALSLYIPNKQGLSDYKVYVDGTEGAFDTSGDLVLFNKTISKDSIPDNLKIKVQAQTSVERDAYSLGIRITPDTRYIKKLREELKQRIKDKNSILGPLLTLIEFIEDPNNSTQFDDGFNLLDTRITAIAPPENGSERAVGYNDSLRSFYLNKTNNGKVDIKISETIDLKNINSVIGSEIYTNKIPTNNIGISTQNLSIIARGTPVVKIYIPKIDGSYELVSTLNNGKPTETQFNKTISDLRAAKRLLPGTIIEYDYSATYGTGNEFISIGIDLNKREVYNEQLLKYTEANKFAEAKLINIGNKQNTYRVGKYVFKKKDEKYNKYVLFKIIETGENGYCVNPGIDNPTGNTHFHKKVVVEPGEGLNALENAIEKYKKEQPLRNYKGEALLKRLKKIFFYYDKYEREHNLDVINDEDTKYQIRNARQAAIFDAVCNKGKDFLDQGFNNGDAVADSETRRYYNELNNIIDNEPDLTEEQLNSVTITLYPVANNTKIQNIITGEVENPVYIEKVGQDGEPLFGAEFVIIQNGIEVKRWISDGQAKELYLEPGEYILRETKAPDGYKVIDDVRFIVDKIVTVNDIKISRTDTFNKYYSSQERYTDNVIKIESNDNITISSDGHTLKAINKKNSFKLRKVDGTDESKLLKNAEFALYKIIDSGNSTTREEFVETRTTNESGEIEFAGLDTGSYILKENMAPEGYKKIDEFLYVDVQKNGDISFRDANKNGSIEMNYYEVITGTPIQKKVKETQLISKTEHPTIEYHGRFKDYLNMKTQVISQDINTVKSRIILNPSTDNINGNGPNQPTYLTLTKKEASKLKYTVHKVSASEKGMLNNNTGFNRAEFYADGEIKGTSKEIFFDTTSTRWNGEAYVVDITAFYDEMETGTTAERNISYKWGNKPTPTVAENYLDGEVGVNVECLEKTILVPTPPIVKVKNYKTYDFKIEKVDSKVDENGNLIHLQGAEFTLYEFTSNEETERKVVKTVTTDENGIAEFKDIKIGKYILKETKAPDGYNKINTPIIVNISKDGDITFNSSDTSGTLDENVFKFIPATEKTEENKIFKSESVEKYPNIKYTRYTDFMNVKTKLVNSEPTTVKTRIFLNPSTDSTDGKGPNEYTTLDLVANNSISTSYIIYKVSEDKKSSIEYNTPLGDDLVYTSGDFKDGRASIGFKTYGKNVEPGKPDNERWHGDAYIVDITSEYAPDVNDKLVHFDWKFCRVGNKVETNIEGDVGAKSGYVTETVTNKTIPILQVKNSKGPKVTIVKVDEDDSNHKIPGAKFEIFHEGENTPIKQKDGNDFVMTGDDGKATFEDLEPGKTYIINEKEAPDGYIKAEKTWKVIVGEDKTITVIESSITNSKNTIIYSDRNGKPALSISASIVDKKDGTYKGILDIESLYDSNDALIEKMVFGLDNDHFEYKYNGVNSTYSVDKINWENGYPVNKEKGKNQFTFDIIPKKGINATAYKPIQKLSITEKTKNIISTDIHLPELSLQKIANNKDKSNEDNSELQNSKEFTFKISNKPKGKEKIIIHKTTEDGKTPLKGVEFKIYKIDSKGEKIYKGKDSTGEDGILEFSVQEPGVYILEEVKTAEGYVVSKEPFIIRIGDLKGDETYNNPNPKDISTLFEFDKVGEKPLMASRIREGRYKTVYPNDSESIYVQLKYKVNNENRSIGDVKPGDTFALEFNDSVDLDGIDITPDNEFDIYGDYGKFAKAEVLGKYPNRRIIKYTVQNYDQQNQVENISMIIPVYVNRFKFKSDKTIAVQAKVVSVENAEKHVKEYDDSIFDDKSFNRSIDVNYSDYFKDITVENIVAYMRELHNKDKSFKAVAYVNAKGLAKYGKTITLSSTKNININNVKIYKVIDWSKEPMPDSFGLNFGKPPLQGLAYNSERKNLLGKWVTTKTEDNDKITEKRFSFQLPDSNYNYQSGSYILGTATPYVLEIEGNVIGNGKPDPNGLNNDTNITDFELKYSYEEKHQFYDGYAWNEITSTTFWKTWSEFYLPDFKADGAHKIKIKNYKNKIEYTKVDGSIKGTAIDTKPEENTEDTNKPIETPRPMFSSEGKALAGVEFQLQKKNTSGVFENYDGTKTSDTNGKFSWEGLPEGEYQVVETGTSSEYSKPKEPVSSFKVNEKGEIVNIKDNTTIIKNYKKPNIEFNKIDGRDKTLLKDAEFTLYKAKVENDSPVIDGDSLKFEVVNREVEESGKKDVKEYTAISDENGHFKFEKLEDGIYAVKETKEPDGYIRFKNYVFYFKVEGTKIYRVNKLGEYVDDTKDKNKVTEAKKDEKSLIVNMEKDKAQVNPIQIENFKAEYPATGGVGALPFVFIGMMIMMAGAYMFIRRRDALYE